MTDPKDIVGVTKDDAETGAWQLEEIAARHMRDHVPGALAIQCEVKAKKIRAALSAHQGEG